MTSFLRCRQAVALCNDKLTCFALPFDKIVVQVGSFAVYRRIVTINMISLLAYVAHDDLVWHLTGAIIADATNDELVPDLGGV